MKITRKKLQKRETQKAQTQTHPPNQEAFPVPKAINPDKTQSNQRKTPSPKRIR